MSILCHNKASSVLLACVVTITAVDIGRASEDLKTHAEEEVSALTAEISERLQLMQQCADKVMPALSVTVADLAVEAATLGGKYVATIPVKKPGIGITKVIWHDDNLSYVLSYIRLLRSGGIAALIIRPYQGPPWILLDLQHVRKVQPGMTQATHRAMLDRCDKVEIGKFLQKCQTCEVLEWVDVMP